MVLVTQQIFEKFEFARCQFQSLIATRDLPCHKVYLQIAGFEAKNLFYPASTQECPNSGEKFRECEGLHQVIIATTIKPQDAILDGVLCRQNQDRSLHPAFAQRSKDLDPVSPWEHQVKHEQIEHLCVGAKESVLTGFRHHDIVVLPFKSFFQGSCHLSFIFDNKDTHVRFFLSVKRLASQQREFQHVIHLCHAPPPDPPAQGSQ